MPKKTAQKVKKVQKKKSAPKKAEENEKDISSNTLGAMMAQTPVIEGPSKGSESPASSPLKNFRHHPDIENFYRFVFEHDLRFEALDILTELHAEKLARKKLKLTKSRMN